jgi:hypothetical protein
MLIEEVYQRSLGIEEHYLHRTFSLTHAGPYDASIAALVQGLEGLGFRAEQGGDVDFSLLTANTAREHDGFKVLVADTFDQVHSNPDVVFLSQKPHSRCTFYLPYGIRQEYLEHCPDRHWDDRGYDFAAVKGPGHKREQLFEWLRMHTLPGRVFNGKPGDLWGLLGDTRFFVYPGVSESEWDSKLLWQAMAAGCILLMEQPPIDMSQYDVRDIAFVYPKLPIKVEYDPKDSYEKIRSHLADQARRYFSPTAIARYFLRKIWDYRRLTL